MKVGLYAALYFLTCLPMVWAESTGSDPVPPERVKDENQLMTLPGLAVLKDSLDSIAEDRKIQLYVVLLKDQTVDEAGKLCDQWQAQWVPKGLGGVFVYTARDKKYCFTATPELLELFGADKLETVFLTAAQDPPLKESLDVVISVPVHRIVSRLGEIQAGKSEQSLQASNEQVERWEIIAGIVGVLALIGWVLGFSRFISASNQGSGKINIPPPGMAYRNPPRRSRSGRRSRSEDEGSDDKERKKRRDRF